MSFSNREAALRFRSLFGQLESYTDPNRLFSIHNCEITIESQHRFPAQQISKLSFSRIAHTVSNWNPPPNLLQECPGECPAGCLQGPSLSSGVSSKCPQVAFGVLKRCPKRPHRTLPLQHPDTVSAALSRTLPGTLRPRRPQETLVAGCEVPNSKA